MDPDDSRLLLLMHDQTSGRWVAEVLMQKDPDAASVPVRC
jgi:hypothetical protein